MRPRQNCGMYKRNEIETESECKEAAKDLEMTFFLAVHWKRVQRNCLIARNLVFFNKDTGKAPNQMENDSFRAVCLRNPKPPSERSFKRASNYLRGHCHAQQLFSVSCCGRVRCQAIQPILLYGGGGISAYCINFPPGLP